MNKFFIYSLKHEIMNKSNLNDYAKIVKIEQKHVDKIVTKIVKKLQNNVNDENYDLTYECIFCMQNCKTFDELIKTCNSFDEFFIKSQTINELIEQL
jgi:hypothetical protein